MIGFQEWLIEAKKPKIVLPKEPTKPKLKMKLKGVVSDEWENTPEEKEEILKDKISEHPFDEGKRAQIKSGLQSLSMGSKEMNHAYRVGAATGTVKKDKDEVATFDHIFNPEHKLSVPKGSILYHGTNKEPTLDENGHHIRNHVISTTPNFHEAVNHASRKKRADKTEESDKHHVIAIHHEDVAPAVNISQHSLRSKGENEVVHAAAKLRHIGSDNCGVNPNTNKTIMVHHFEVEYPNPRHNTYEQNKELGLKALKARRQEFIDAH